MSWIRAFCPRHMSLLPRDLLEISHPDGGGARLALPWSMRAVVAACCLLTGCLVTKKDFPQEPFCPPSVETATLEAAPRPLGSVIKVDLAEDPSGDAGSGVRDLTFEVEIRDCNEDQELFRYVVLQKSPTERTLDAGTIAPEQRNPYSFEFSGLNNLVAGRCYPLELRVSSAFQFGTDQPEDSEDLGTATWWIAAFDSSDPSAAGVEMVSCQ